MNRRGFLGSILALGAAPAIVRADSLMRVIPLDTEIIVLSGNTLLTIDMITKEALRILHKNMVFVKSVNDDFAKQYAKKYASLRIHHPDAR